MSKISKYIKKNRMKAVLSVVILAFGFLSILVLALLPDVVFYKKDMLKDALLTVLAAAAPWIPFTVRGTRAKWLDEFLMLFASVVSYAMMADLNMFTGNYPLTMKNAVMNGIVLFFLYKLVYILIGRLWITVLLSGMICFIWGAANYYVETFRGMAILPWEVIAGAGAAANVAGGYQFFLYKQELFWALAIIFFAGMCFHVQNGRSLKFRISYGILAFVVTTGILFGLCVSPQFEALSDDLCLIQMRYATQGIPVSFLHYARLMFTEMPEGYSVEECERIVELYNDEWKAAAGANAPTPKNVIIIMSESFSDFSLIGQSDIVDECTPFFRSLKENTIRGNIYVPVYGAGTVNSEYEGLTGNSIVFQKGLPFSYAVQENRPSIARIFKDLGYSTYGLHLFKASNYNRVKVYPYLGIDDFVTIETVGNDTPEKYRMKTSDSWNFKEIEELDRQNGDKPFFMFNVTYQNHAGYEDPMELADELIDLSEYGDMPKAEVYMTLMKKSDDALRELITYYEACDEPTMIMFFGDHQPKVEDDFYNMVYGGNLAEAPLDVQNLKYTTPFFIWANYDIKEQDLGVTSANYLPELVLEAADVALPPYYQLLHEMREKYPVFSVNEVIDEAGNNLSYEDVMDDPLVRDYRFLEYNNVNDKSENVLWDAYGCKSE